MEVQLTPIWGVRGHMIAAERNPHIAELWHEFDLIVEELSAINKIVVRQYIPSRPGRREIRTYDYLERRVDGLQLRMNEWRKNAWDFINLPTMDIVTENNVPADPKVVEMLTTHAVRCHIALRADMTHYQTLLSSNYQQLVSDATSTRDFNLAMRSYWIAIAGLVASLGALIYTLVTV